MSFYNKRILHQFYGTILQESCNIQLSYKNKIFWVRQENPYSLLLLLIAGLMLCTDSGRHITSVPTSYGDLNDFMPERSHRNICTNTQILTHNSPSQTAKMPSSKLPACIQLQIFTLIDSSGNTLVSEAAR